MNFTLPIKYQSWETDFLPLPPLWNAPYASTDTLLTHTN